MEDDLIDNNNIMDDDQNLYDNADNDNEDNDNNAQIDENDSNSDRRFAEPEGNWMNWFCRLEENMFFVEIDEEFLKNKANLIGIKTRDHLEIILSPEPPDESAINEEYMEQISQIKETYGLIHKRFITTPKGLALMREKYLNGIYGHCPRIMCEKQILLPCAISEDMKYSRVKVFCPLCEEVYKPRVKCDDMDGAYFGTSFPQMFLMSYPDLNPKLQVYKKYVPKLYGFKIFGKTGSKYYTEDKKELIEKMKKLNISIDN